jgi:uncharacterized protein
MRFAGYAAIFDRPDSGGDIVRKGAFAGASKPLPLLWMHDPKQRIGTVDYIEEDARGLRMKATLDGKHPVSPGHGLSFGYRVRQARKGTFRELTNLELIEISLVTQPMQPLARVIAVQSNQGE